METDLSRLTPAELLRLHVGIVDELRTRGITRSSNNPTGDIAEYIFCRALGLALASNSNRSVDAVGTDGSRYQIKGRRVTRENKSRQLSAIRDLDKGQFDFLAAILFDHHFNINRGAIIPYSVVARRSTRVERTNSHRFLLRDDIWEDPGVHDVTERLRQVPLG